MKPITAAFLSLALVACGAAGTDTAEAAPPAAKTVPSASGPARPVAKPAQTAEERAAARAEKAAQRAAERKKMDEDLAARGVKRIGWEDLMPEGENERLAQMYQAQMAMLFSSPVAEGGAGDVGIQIGTFNTVKELNGKKIMIPGYTVPFEFGPDAQIKEFLLVPQFGQCLHNPPPPPNQTIFVMADKAIKMKDLAQAVWIEGTIYTQIQESELADAAYTIKLDRITEYTY
ncbi:DUF3299 domain-containing protein [Hyphomonas sp.]|uniref:DUF3299 domain-containing protein n=1 Tax=Hyphomonas sp. TaxID=87 RepID=UPI003919AEE7